MYPFLGGGFNWADSDSILYVLICVEFGFFAEGSNVGPFWDGVEG